jgi:hypothetical protein
MARLASIAVILGLAGCSSPNQGGVSLSQYKWIDSNCTGNGFITNPSWCTNEFHASMGPYAAKAPAKSS